MEAILRGLNAAQRAAVTSPASVLQVLAPPGSGKTKTLTSRVAYLLAHHGYAPWNVICCTFTIKASKEMRERLRGLVGELESKLILGTFHSICRRYLVRYGDLIGLPKNFGIADSSDSLSIIKRAVKHLNLSIDPKVARSKISHSKARGKRIEDLPKVSEKKIDQQEFVTIYQEYEKALATSNLLDYDDLLLRCTELLKAHPQCVSNVEALLIDEFQDTNVVQFELMKLLASAKERITVVGDPDQSIYGFRSAEVENLRKMKTYYPELSVINLEENYRSSSAVLRLAQDVIEQDTHRPDKKLKSTHCYGTLPVLRRLPNPHEEALWIVSEIRRLTAMTGGLLRYSDFAILLRSAFLSLLIEKALGNAGIPYRMVGGHRFFDRVEIRLVIDYLRTISAPDNNSALLAVINVPSRKMGETTIKELQRVAEGRKLSLWSTIQRLVSGHITLEKKLAKPVEQNLRRLVGLIDDGRKKMQSTVPEDTPRVLIEYVVSAIALRDWLKLKYEEDHEDRWENVQELLTQARDMVQQQTLAAEEQLPEIDGLEPRHVDSSQEVLLRFLANIVLSTEVETSEEEESKPRVTISTIHSAKGLEWPVVFVPAVYEGSIPHSRAEDTDEERRLLYVAMTRAQALLSLSFPLMQSRDMGESILSQFLPSTVLPKVSQTGPTFSDKVVDDIASILRRPLPSQEDMIRGMQILTNKDSTTDNVWPADGSRRPISEWSDNPRLMSVPGNATVELFEPFAEVEYGESMKEALTSGSLLRSKRSNFVGPGRRLMSTTSTATRDATESVYAKVLTGFTTANDQHRASTMASATNKYTPKAPPTALSESAGTGKPPAKVAKLDRSQSDIGSFFLQRSTRPQSLPVTADSFCSQGRTLSTWHPGKTLHVESTLPPLIASKMQIPVELSSHKLPTKPAPSAIKRPRSVLGETNSPNRGRKHYVFLSSSPPRDIEADSAVKSIIANENSKSETTAKAVMTKGGYHVPVCAPVAQTTPTMSLVRPATTMHITSMGLLQQHGGVRKTLGVKRSMNGWDTRKNK